ncbi:hypothetical protein [Streptomyces sp. NPDC059909]|uniref:hypothetical protein n=1 Tax=Streptomyces sp. NPDC059909 TaxID=3346998 RepID=UPI003651408A
MIVLQPVLEVCAPADFGLWPIAETEPDGFLPLSGALTPAEVGTAVMRIADYNDVPEADEHPSRPADPLGAFLRGLLATDDLLAPGGLRVTDTVTGVTVLPGCCNGLEERGDWLKVFGGDGWASFGHDPSPLAERVGETVRLTVDAERDDSSIIELPANKLRRLLAGAERDLADFLDLATTWAARFVPEHAGPVAAAIARALALQPSPSYGGLRTTGPSTVK